MLGLWKVVCAVCDQQVARRQSWRAKGGGGAAVCRPCYEEWEGAGRHCAGCETAVRGTQEVGFLANRRSLGHADCAMFA